MLSSDHPASLLQQHGAANLGIGNLISGLPPQSNNLNTSAIQQSQLINQLGAPIRQSNNLLNSTNTSRQPGATQNLNDSISPPQNMMVNLGGGGQPNSHMIGQQQLLLTNGPNSGPNSLLFRTNGLGPNVNQKNLPSQQQQQLNLNNSPNNGNNNTIHSQMIQQQRIQQQSHLQQQQVNNRPDLLKIPIYNSNSNNNSVNNNNNNNRNSQVNN